MKSKSRSKKVQSIRLTLLQASEEFGVSRETLRRLIKTTPNFKPAPDGKFTLREVHALLAGDARTERARLTTAKADREELELRKAKGELVPVEWHLRAIREVMLNVRQRLMAMPIEVAHLANPADPIHARKAFESWRDANKETMYAGGIFPDTCPTCGAKKK